MRLKRPPPHRSQFISKCQFTKGIILIDCDEHIVLHLPIHFTNFTDRESNTMQTCSLWHPHLWIISSKNKCKYQLKLPNRSTNNQTTKFLSIVNKELNEFIDDDDDDAFYYGKRYHLLLSLVHRIHAHCSLYAQCSIINFHGNLRASMYKHVPTWWQRLCVCIGDQDNFKYNTLLITYPFNCTQLCWSLFLVLFISIQYRFFVFKSTVIYTWKQLKFSFQFERFRMILS